jgi:hypothetical protein
MQAGCISHYSVEISCLTLIAGGADHWYALQLGMLRVRRRKLSLSRRCKFPLTRPRRAALAQKPEKGRQLRAGAR